jgi:hypothetical protein
VTAVDAADVVGVAFDAVIDVALYVVVGVSGAADFPLEPHAASSIPARATVTTDRTRMASPRVAASALTPSPGSDQCCAADILPLRQRLCE